MSTEERTEKADTTIRTGFYRILWIATNGTKSRCQTDLLVFLFGHFFFHHLFFGFTLGQFRVQFRL